MRPPSARVAARIAGACLAAGLLLGACGDDDAEGASAGAADTTAASPGPADPSATEGGGAGTVACTAGDAGGMAPDATGVEISGFTFRPGDVEIDAGTAITFANEDDADHSVWSAERIDSAPAWTTVGSDPEFRLPEVLHQGDSSTCTFDAAGTYEYLCGVHNSMTGTVVVR